MLGWLLDVSQNELRACGGLVDYVLLCISSHILRDSYLEMVTWKGIF